MQRNQRRTARIIPCTDATTNNRWKMDDANDAVEEDEDESNDDDRMDRWSRQHLVH